MAENNVIEHLEKTIAKMDEIKSALKNFESGSKVFSFEGSIERIGKSILCFEKEIGLLSPELKKNIGVMHECVSTIKNELERLDNARNTILSMEAWIKKTDIQMLPKCNSE